MLLKSYVMNSHLSLSDRIILALYCVKYATVEQLNYLNPNDCISTTRNVIVRMKVDSSSNSLKSDFLKSVTCSRGNENVAAYKLTSSGLVYAHNLMLRVSAEISDTLSIESEAPEVSNYSMAKSALDHYVAGNDFFFAVVSGGQYEVVNWCNEYVNNLEIQGLRPDGFLTVVDRRMIIEQDLGTLRAARLSEKFIRMNESMESFGFPDIVFGLEQPFKIEKRTLGSYYKNDEKLAKLSDMQQIVKALIAMYDEFGIDGLSTENIRNVKAVIVSKFTELEASALMTSYRIKKYTSILSVCERMLIDEKMMKFGALHNIESLKGLLKGDLEEQIKNQKCMIKDKLSRPTIDHRIGVVKRVIREDDELRSLYDRLFERGLNFYLESNRLLMNLLKSSFSEKYNDQEVFKNILGELKLNVGEITLNVGHMVEGKLLISRFKCQSQSTYYSGIYYDDLIYNIASVRRLELMMESGVFQASFKQPRLFIYRHNDLQAIRELARRLSKVNSGNSVVVFVLNHIGDSGLEVIPAEEVETYSAVS